MNRRSILRLLGLAPIAAPAALAAASAPCVAPVSRADADAWLGRSIDRIESGEAQILSEAFTRATADRAQIAHIGDLHSRVSLADAPFTFDGERLRIPNLRSSYTVKAMPDGSSRFAVNAQSFAVKG